MGVGGSSDWKTGNALSLTVDNHVRRMISDDDDHNKTRSVNVNFL